MNKLDNGKSDQMAEYDDQEGSDNMEDEEGLGM
jgi:hypothetical protein